MFATMSDRREEAGGAPSSTQLSPPIQFDARAPPPTTDGPDPAYFITSTWPRSPARFAARACGAWTSASSITWADDPKMRTTRRLRILSPSIGGGSRRATSSGCSNWRSISSEQCQGWRGQGRRDRPTRVSPLLHPPRRSTRCSSSPATPPSNDECSSWRRRTSTGVRASSCLRPFGPPMLSLRPPSRAHPFSLSLSLSGSPRGALCL